MKPIKAARPSFLFFAATAALLFHSGLFAIGPDYSGSWYNPEQDGHGFSLEYSVLNDGTPIVVAYWYVYDNEGNPIFLVGQGEAAEGNRVTLEFVAPYGMKFGEFDPEDVVRADGGSGVFTFENSDVGVFEYEPSVWMIETYGVSTISTPVVKLLAVTLDEPSSFDSYVETYLGSWRGRMNYDRRSPGNCDDADVRLEINTRSTGGFRFHSITVIRDAGGQATYSFGYWDVALFYSQPVATGDFRVFNEMVDMNIEFPPNETRGHAEGYWNYRSGNCYGEWTFTKD